MTLIEHHQICVVRNKNCPINLHVFWNWFSDSVLIQGSLLTVIQYWLSIDLIHAFFHNSNEFVPVKILQKVHIGINSKTTLPIISCTRWCKCQLLLIRLKALPFHHNLLQLHLYYCCFSKTFEFCCYEKHMGSVRLQQWNKLQFISLVTGCYSVFM